MLTPEVTPIPPDEFRPRLAAAGLSARMTRDVLGSIEHGRVEPAVALEATARELVALAGVVVQAAASGGDAEAATLISGVLADLDRACGRLRRSAAAVRHAGL